MNIEKNGMLGMCVLTVAVGLSIFATVLMSADVNESTVTKYDYLTDVTGLFPVDTSPQYFDYDLSQNYTGYYTDDTVVGNNNYWGGATFTRSPTVNNYPVVFEPDELATIRVDDIVDHDFELNPNTNSFGATYYYKSANTGENVWFNASARSCTMSSIIDYFDVEDYQYITITSPYIDPTREESGERMGILLFTTIDQYYRQQNGGTTGDYVEYSIKADYPTANVACFSCKIDTTSQTVDYYYGTQPTTDTYVRTVPLANALVILPKISYPTSPWAHTIDIDASTFPATQYMDISQGVTVTG